MGTKASDVAYIDAESSFGLTFRRETVRGNREEITVSSFRDLGFGEEENVRFRGEMVFHGMIISVKIN